jgi:hypothetical protein
MARIMNYPMLVGVITFACLCASAGVGAFLRKHWHQGNAAGDDEFPVVLAATLSLLGLLIGFSFSMATSRYEQRKDDEEEEANAIGTEYLRVELLPGPISGTLKAQLKEYTDLRIRKFEQHASEDFTQLADQTGHMQNEMWSEVRAAAAAKPDPLSAVAVTGMNDVINRQGYTQAARWNRIPLAAWGLMLSIAVFSNVLLGFGAERASMVNMSIVPIVIAVSFFLIADIDSPQGGLIRVAPQNLHALADSLKQQ